MTAGGYDSHIGKYLHYLTFISISINAISLFARKAGRRLRICLMTIQWQATVGGGASPVGEVHR